MAIIQISKIQQRSGNLVDLPQLDEAQFGWATDAKRLFIGKTLPNENVEVLTSYSTISFGQIDGSYGNINITAVQNGQILTYDSTSNVWVNAGGNATQPGNTELYSTTPIHLGDVSTLHIGGGAIGYVLETDGTGNLNWTPKGTVRANVINLIPDISNAFGIAANAVIMKVANTTPYTNGTPVTITGANGNSNSSVNSTVLYVKLANDFPESGNTILFSSADLSNVLVAGDLTYTNSPNAIATTAVGGSGGSGIGGSTYSIIYNNGGVGTGDSNLTYNFNTNLLTLNGTANVSSLNATSLVTGTQLISTTSTGTAPIQVSSTTRIANANVETAGNLVNGTSNVIVASNISMGVNGTANILVLTTLGANITGNAVASNINAGNGSITNTLLMGSGIGGSLTGANLVSANYITGVLTTSAQPNITSIGTLASVSVTGNANVGNLFVDSLGTVTTLSISTGSNVTEGNITGNWILTSGSKLQSTYADLAEYYEADALYEPGTVLEFGGEKEVTLAEDSTSRVAGVVSTNPAYVMNTQCLGEHIVALALQGRVPVKVRGKISKGDMLVSGGNGYARPMRNPMIGTVIGKALQDFEGITGIIEVSVGRL